MISIDKIRNEKTSVILHKGGFVLKKKVHGIIDSKLSNMPRIVNVKPIESYRFVRINSDYDDTDKVNILNRSFYWLGMNGDKIQENTWTTDFLSGFNWRNQYFQKITTVDLSSNAEVKIPWELSRLQHLTRLAIIAQQEGTEEDIAAYIKSEIKSWLTCNPYKNSVNWTCAMEVAIRAINMIFIALILPYQLFEDSEFHRIYITSLYYHGLFIKQNLETYDEYYNNHYLSDLLGLQWIGLFCEEHMEGKLKKTVHRWREFAHKELANECSKQIFPDGTDYESSIGYHRYVLELFCLSVYIDRIYDKETDETLIKSISRMTRFLEEIRMPDNELPMIGDSDDGRILILENYSNWNKRSANFLLERINQYLNGDLSYMPKKVDPPLTNSVVFRDSGYYLLRNERIYCLTHCGPLSLHGHGGHSHNDQLSVILSFDGTGVVVDSGTGSYSGNPGLRNYFRSTKAHSTVEVIGYEQNALIEDSLYMMREKTFSKCLGFTDTLFAGEHSGYSEIGIKHKRIIKLGDDDITVEDYITGCVDPAKKWSSHFILDFDVTVRQINETEFQLRKNGITVKMESNIPLVQEKTIVSKEYGRTLESLKISTIPSSVERIYTKFILGGK